MPFSLAQHKVIQDKVRNAFLHKFLFLGQLIRNISLVRKEAGVCLDKDKAVYWDGRNNFGTPYAPKPGRRCFIHLRCRLSGLLSL